MEFINRSVEDLKDFGASRHNDYVHADPFPNTYFDDFFIPEKLSEVLDEFPDLTKGADLTFHDANQVKLASKGEYRFGPKTLQFMHFMNSQPFLEFLSALTGIENLIPDPFFDGGGCHQIQPGGMLKIHADFNKHPTTKLDRRLNVLVYMNKDWKEEYGGHFEMWDRSIKQCVKKVAPQFNRLVVFNTTDFSFHGHPDPLNCPPYRTRKSLATFYYTNGRPDVELSGAHSSMYKARPGENFGRDGAKTDALATTYALAMDLLPPALIRTLAKARRRVRARQKRGM